jgi:dolichyl-phosphate-mannose--protein O-mannosyl transferase
MFLFANFSEYNGLIQFEGGDRSHVYDSGDYIPLRITPTFFGSLCAPVVYLAVRFGSFSKCAAVTAACLVCFDTSFLTEHRFILSDAFLHFFSVLHILILCYGLGIPRGTAKFFVWQMFIGLSLGAACSCKNTAWGLIALNAAIPFVDLFVTNSLFTLTGFEELIQRGFILGISCITVYIASFLVHFVLLPYESDLVASLPSYMQHNFVSTKWAGFEIWGVRVSGTPVVWRAIVLSIIMHTGNMGITQWHPAQSRPVGWPLLTDIRVPFWGHNNCEIACMGNVFSYYLAFIGLFLVIFAKKDPKWVMGMKFVVGWAASYFPFYLVPRVMYLYHYLIPLALGSIAFGCGLDLVVPPLFRGFVAVFACVLAIVGFFLWSPFCYGTPLWDRAVTIWNKNWIEGDAVHRSQFWEANPTAVRPQSNIQIMKD